MVEERECGAWCCSLRLSHAELCQGARVGLSVARISGPGTVFASTVSAACNTYWVDLHEDRQI